VDIFSMAQRSDMHSIVYVHKLRTVTGKMQRDKSSKNENIIQVIINRKLFILGCLVSGGSPTVLFLLDNYTGKMRDNPFGH
jgi:hypothetical protein